MLARRHAAHAIRLDLDCHKLWVAQSDDLRRVDPIRISSYYHLRTFGRVSSRRFQRTYGAPVTVTTAHGAPANVHSYGSPSRTWV